MEKDSSKASRIQDLAEQSLTTASTVERLELSEKVITEWRKMSCQDKFETGKALEKTRESNERNGTTFAEFTSQPGSRPHVSELIFYKKDAGAGNFPQTNMYTFKYQDHKRLAIKDPFKECSRD